MTELDRAAARHFGLVHALCRRFRDRGVEYEELFAAGCLGLSKALQSFDRTRGVQFSTYAFPVIAGEIKRLFRDGGTVHVSRSLKELALKIERLGGQDGSLTVSELARRLGEPEERIADAIAASRAPLSLTAGEDGQPLELPAPDIQDEITERLTLRAALGTLAQQDQTLIRLRYFQGKTQAETATILQMTQVQVSRREKKLLTALRMYFENTG